MTSKQAKSIHPATALAASNTHLRFDPPAADRPATTDPLMWSLQEELAREMSSRLSVISSCLGACRLLTSGHQEASLTGQLQAALAMANEEIFRVSEINRSSRCLTQLQSDHTRSYTINHALDDALRILRHKFRVNDIVVDLRRPTCRAVYESPELPLVLIALIDSLVERLCHQPAGGRVLSIATSIQRTQTEILLSCPAAPSNHVDGQAVQPAPSAAQRPTDNGLRNEELARAASKRLGCSVRFGTTRLGDQAYCILFETEHGLQKREGQI